MEFQAVRAACNEDRNSTPTSDARFSHFFMIPLFLSCGMIPIGAVLTRATLPFMKSEHLSWKATGTIFNPRCQS